MFLPYLFAPLSTYVFLFSLTHTQLINRRRLKSGPGMKPITYYIDPTVPVKWREAFRAGVHAWRPAFAAAGFGPKAIRAVLPGEKDFPEDYQVMSIYIVCDGVASLSRCCCCCCCCCVRQVVHPS